MPSIAALDRRCFLKATPGSPSTESAEPRWFRSDRPSHMPMTARESEQASQERKPAPAAA